MDPRDEFIASSKVTDIRKAVQAAGAEDRYVRLLVTAFKIPPRYYAHLKVTAPIPGMTERFTFALFNRVVANFPIWLGYEDMGSTSLHLHKDATMSALFNRFKQAPWIGPYEEFFAHSLPHAGDKAIGMVFPRKLIMNGLILHNGQGLLTYYMPGTTVMHTAGTATEPKSLYLQAFTKVVRAIRDNGWKPEYNV